jgi:hypothetical protein
MARHIFAVQWDTAGFIAANNDAVFGEFVRCLSGEVFDPKGP